MLHLCVLGEEGGDLMAIYTILTHMGSEILLTSLCAGCTPDNGQMAQLLRPLGPTMSKSALWLRLSHAGIIRGSVGELDARRRLFRICGTWKINRFCENRHNGSGEKKEKAETHKNKKV